MSVHQLNAETRSRTDVIVIGAGQAGMSASYYLCRAGIEHVVFERSERFHTWKNERWDTFCLVTPNWQCRLPDFPYRGKDPEGFMLKDEIVDYVEGFAGSFDAPLWEGVRVTRVAELAEGGFEVDTTAGNWHAAHVIVASGGYDTPILPAFAGRLDDGIKQLHSRHYKRPEDVPEGTCLVVGTGQSGVQMMEDLWIAGRDVRLAVGPAPRSPRRYRGRDATDWLYEMGHYDQTIDQQPDPKATEAKTNHYMSGRDGGHEIDLRQFARDGLQLYGSVSDMEGGVIRFLPDLEKNLDEADRSYMGIRDAIDVHISGQGLDVAPAPAFEKVWRPEREVTEIDAVAEGITSVLWCIGFRPDYSWLKVDCLDERGKPVHRRGVCAREGVYFLGLGWLNKWGSGRFLSVAEDAEFVVGCIAERLRGGAERRARG
ncbi:MSMEG_0569 family flavin-dependent oxidoreductase [Algicella marina]|uniref:MSMEG_0569 family flavin-dependent oxidoreductase n=1 Tax=Algicella marina TaxID=2683284 RepID=A0A6P1SUJ4_9RHOB|nr:MSMEG_0569 family flavin-dependent oxidoreductase [Algicella marina]QHQ34354.1 MSMEG_0569 family flavin-dependent oxidoreductase [Algicella marina]